MAAVNAVQSASRGRCVLASALLAISIRGFSIAATTEKWYQARIVDETGTLLPVYTTKSDCLGTTVDPGVASSASSFTFAMGHDNQLR